MKKLFFLVFMATPFLSIAQDEMPCGFNDEISWSDSNIFSYSIDPAYLATFEPVVYNIYYWQVNDPNGNYGNEQPLTETSVLESVARLNITYNPFNIFFKYTGFSCFDSPNDVIVEAPAPPDGFCAPVLDSNGNPIIDTEGYGRTHTCQTDNLFSFAANNGYKDPNAFNVYVPYKTSGGFGGKANAFGKTEIVIPRDRLTSVTSNHEIAHCFAIKHTRSKNSAIKENVTREKYLPDGITINPDYTAESGGDFVVDTHAIMEFSYGGTYPYINGGCEYFGTEQDITGRFYSDELTIEDVKNAMSDAYECVDYVFTTGQAIRMRETIIFDPYQAFIAAQTSVSVLYEPYRGVYYEQGPANDPHDAPLFQPGFDYEFISCDCQGIDNLDCSLPCDYENTSFHNNHTMISNIDKFENDYPSITHPNHTAIRIPILDGQPRRCYDNWNRDAIGGSVIKFNDNVLNTNITVTPQDSLGINNENLINDLPVGLYKIEKAYDDGTSQEKVIYKENN